jgi:high-affinity Fe2+/Pb2+ permease
VAEPGTPPREPGWPQVALVAGAVVAVVIGAAILTGFLPAEIQRAIFYGPVLIGVLIVGTAWLLWRVAHGRPLDGGQ